MNENSIVTISPEQLFKYETEADKYWDKFYGIHNNGYVWSKQHIFIVKLFRILDKVIGRMLFI